jgi:proton glutamate symport protein
VANYIYLQKIKQMKLLKKISLTQWIFIAMILGVFCGIYFPEVALETERFGKIFLRLIKTLVAPLIFSTLVLGIAGHSPSLKDRWEELGLKSLSSTLKS